MCAGVMSVPEGGARHVRGRTSEVVDTTSKILTH